MINVSMIAEDGEPVGLNPCRQADWRKIVDGSAYTPTAIMAQYNINESNFYGWLALRSSPREAAKERMIDVMKALMSGEKRIQKHPSYGYATPEQIEKLNKLGICPEREQILSQITKQNEKKGKIR